MKEAMYARFSFRECFLLANTLIALFFVTPAWADPLPWADNKEEPSVYRGVDDNYHALYGGYGTPIKNIVTSVKIKSATSPFDSREQLLSLEARLNDILYEEASKHMPKEADIIVHNGRERFSIENKAETYIIGIEIFFKGGIEDGGFLVIFNPTIGRYSVCLQHPYHQYEKPDAIIYHSESQGSLLAFENVIKPIIYREVKRIVCNKAKSAGATICKD